MEEMSYCFPHFPIVFFGVVKNKGLRRSSDLKSWGLSYLHLTGWVSLGTYPCRTWFFFYSGRYLPPLFSLNNTVKLNVVNSLEFLCKT